MIEEFLWERGYSFIGGVDEAGRGPLAGPLVAACVVLPRYSYLPGVKDSKSLSPSRRKELYREICSSAWTIGIGMVGEKFIDTVGIEKATVSINFSGSYLPSIFFLFSRFFNFRLGQNSLPSCFFLFSSSCGKQKCSSSSGFGSG